MSKQLSPLNMTAEECRQRLDTERRSRNCLPQDIEYWQFYIDFHTHGQAYAESRQRGSAPDAPTLNSFTQIERKAAQAGSPSRGAVAPSSSGIESGPANQFPHSLPDTPPATGDQS